MSNTRCWPWAHKWPKWSEPLTTYNGVLIQFRICESCGMMQRRAVDR